jgi:hypothetical protein
VSVALLICYSREIGIAGPRVGHDRTARRTCRRAARRYPARPGWRFEPKLDGFRRDLERPGAGEHGFWQPRRLRARKRPPCVQVRQPSNTMYVTLMLVSPCSIRALSRWKSGLPASSKATSSPVLAVEGLPTTQQPYSERRALIEELDLARPGVQLVAAFDDGAALFDAVVKHDLEGVVAKRERDRYRPGERLWVKEKNRAAPRFAEEVAAVASGRSRWR